MGYMRYMKSDMIEGDNVVNEYALTFYVPINPSIDMVYFTWYNHNPSYRVSRTKGTWLELGHISERLWMSE